jgi:hypothetical protein
LKEDLAEVHRRLAYDMSRFWEANDTALQPIFRSFRVAAGALVVQILALVALVSDSLL